MVLGAEVSLAALSGGFFLTLAGRQTELHSVFILTQGKVRLSFYLN